MKGTLSLTRVKPQTYSIRGAGRPAFRPRVLPFHELLIVSAIMSRTPCAIFGLCLRSVTPADSVTSKVPLRTSVDARNRLC